VRRVRVHRNQYAMQATPGYIDQANVGIRARVIWAASREMSCSPNRECIEDFVLKERSSTVRFHLDTKWRCCAASMATFPNCIFQSDSEITFPIWVIVSYYRYAFMQDFCGKVTLWYQRFLQASFCKSHGRMGLL